MPKGFPFLRIHMTSIKLMNNTIKGCLFQHKYLTTLRYNRTMHKHSHNIMTMWPIWISLLLNDSDKNLIRIRLLNLLDMHSLDHLDLLKTMDMGIILRTRTLHRTKILTTILQIHSVNNMGIITIQTLTVHLEVIFLNTMLMVSTGTNNRTIIMPNILMAQIMLILKGENCPGADTRNTNNNLILRVNWKILEEEVPSSMHHKDKK